jgi:putative membrane-bound dehydrogenase-like protein
MLTRVVLPAALSALGLSLLFFAVLWTARALWAAATRASQAGALGVLAAWIGALAFVYLTASNPARRAFINLPMRELVVQTATVLAGLALAAVAWLLAAWLARRYAAWIVGLAVAALYAAGAGLLYLATFEPDLDEITVRAPEVSQLTVADGIPITVFENRVIVKPTAIDVGPAGEVYVASIEGQIWLMYDDDQDGHADRTQEFANGLRQPEGLAVSPAGLYVSEIDRVSLLVDVDKDGKSDRKDLIVGGLPGETYSFHQSSGLTFGPDGRLYLGVGATTDHRPEQHPLAARILTFNPDGSDLRVYATGLRNPFAIVPAPGGGFFAVDNGSSGCVDTPTQIDDCSNKIDVPEEVNYITDGKDYGFPNYFGIPPQDSGTEPPIVTFPDHSAPAGLLYYDGARLPSKYVGQLFVGLWIPGEIYSVRLLRTDATHFVGSSRLFARGFAGPTAMHQAPDGSIYVASFTGNTIYTIGQRGPATTSVAAPPSAPTNAKIGEGRNIFMSSCAACHGADGRGLPKLGKALAGNPFVTTQTEDELVAFIRRGRSTHESGNTTGIDMPASGGLPMLTDGQLKSVITFVRGLQ